MRAEGIADKPQQLARAAHSRLYCDCNRSKCAPAPERLPGITSRNTSMTLTKWFKPAPLPPPPPVAAARGGVGSARWSGHTLRQRSDLVLHRLQALAELAFGKRPRLKALGSASCH